MLDFDEIVVNIKNPQIKKYVSESISSYRVSNYRSAIIAIWIAAMFDLVKKFEILTEQREPNLGQKRQIYALAGIREYWVVNLKASQVHVYRQPETGNYQYSEIVQSGKISPQVFPDISVNVSLLFT